MFTLLGFTCYYPASFFSFSPSWSSSCLLPRFFLSHLHLRITHFDVDHNTPRVFFTPCMRLRMPFAQDTVRFSEILWDSVRCCEVRWGAVRFSEVLWGSVRCCEVEGVMCTLYCAHCALHCVSITRYWKVYTSICSNLHEAPKSSTQYRINSDSIRPKYVYGSREALRGELRRGSIEFK